MASCLSNGIDYLVGLVRNKRLESAGRRGHGGSALGGPGKRLPASSATSVVDEGQLPTAAAGGGQGRIDDAGCQSALHPHLACGGTLDTKTLYEELYCARGDREPHQGVQARSPHSPQEDCSGAIRKLPPDGGRDFKFHALRRPDYGRLFYAFRTMDSGASVVLKASRTKSVERSIRKVGAKPNDTDKRRVSHDRRTAKRAEQCSHDEIGEKRGCLFFSGH